jgi:type II secretory pathway predicted ATPase ExeA
MAPSVLGELRILTSAQFDTASYLTTVLSGDGRLSELFRHEDLLPLATRIRTRLVMEYAHCDELLALLKHAISSAGNATLMTEPLMHTLTEHAAGNGRVLMTMAGELLIEGLVREQAQLDEKLYLEVFQVPGRVTEDKGKRRAAAPRMTSR